jgi:hypothetical protein
MRKAMASTRPAAAPRLDASTLPHEVPWLHAVSGARFQARCVKCTRASIPIPTVDARHAWVELTKIGWKTRPVRRGTAHDVLCPGCASRRSP